MRLHFKVTYLTVWGETVFLQTSQCNGANGRYEMQCRWEGKKLIWEATLHLTSTTELHYNYLVVNEGGVEVKAENIMRWLSLERSLGRGDLVQIVDTWQDRSNPHSVVASGAFRRAIGLPTQTKEQLEIPQCTPVESHIVVRFAVRDLMCGESQGIFVCGGVPALGNWQQEKVFRLSESKDSVWLGEVSVALDQFPFTYKYAISNEKGFVLESGDSRLATIDTEVDSDKYPVMVVLEDGNFRRERLWRGSGIAVPVFSLRSRRSMGIGEFSDLKLLVDFCVKIGFDLVQILPVNDTSVHKMWWDSYPYSSLSVFALHPIYVRVEELMEDVPEDLQAEIEEAKDRLDGVEMEYEATLFTKLDLANSIYNLVGKEALESESFKDFFEANKEWLSPYAAFVYLQDVFGTAEHWKWGALARPTEKDISRLVSPDSPRYSYSIGFTYWLQFHLHRQLSSVKLYAEERGVALKGDLPIGVDKCSVDTWLYPSLFRMDKSTGAPPDDFDANGQNWGFPTYNWEEMERDNFAWWRKRLHHMSEFFHAYRIDHILGFFRIWEIPDTSVTAMLGNFRPSHPIHRNELESKSIWDFNRLCNPYVTLDLIRKYFKDLAAEASIRFFQEDGYSRFNLREQYNTERKIQQIDLGSAKWLQMEAGVIKKGLSKCVQNVVLIRNPSDPDSFYPRFDLMSTDSFAELPPNWQEELQRLHDDYYYRRQNDLWKAHANKTLPALVSASDMLVCGEDLGMIPSCVHPVMEEMGLIGMRIQRMPSTGEFADTRSYPYLSVCCPSCHDVSPTRAWWEEDNERSQRFYAQILNGQGTAPSKCTPEIANKIIRQHFLSPSILTILPIQLRDQKDIFALSDKYNKRDPVDEAINDPTNSRHYWRYRIHVDLETLVADDEIAEELHSMLKQSSRGKNYWMGKRCWVKTNGTRS